MVPWWPGTMFGQPTLAQVDPAFLDSVSISEQVTDVVRPFTPPVASSYGTNENPPPCVDPHDVTMMKDLHAHLAAHDPAVAAASLMVQNSIGVTLGNLGALAAWVLERFGSAAPIDVGGALAGSGGVAPALAASGSTAPGATLVLDAQASLAAPLTLWFVLGPTHLGAAFYGGTLVPAPAAVVPLPSDAAGHITLSAPVPPGVPPGVVQYVQFWHADAAGPQG